MENFKLVASPVCDSDACIEQVVTTPEGLPITTWLCMTSGYTTTSALTEGSELVAYNEEHTAELIKDLRKVIDGLVWYPTVVNIPEKGMVFPDWNAETEDWGWKVVKSVPVPEDQKEKFPIPGKPGEFYKVRMDMENPLVFDKYCFMDAAEHVGMFNIEAENKGTTAFGSTGEFGDVSGSTK